MKTKSWIKAFRLRTLPLALSVILAGTAVSYFRLEHFICDDCSMEEMKQLVWQKPDLTTLLLTFLTTLFLQILSNLANDYGDFSKGTDNKNRVGPERALQSGGITKKQMLNAIILFSLLSFVSGITLLYWTFVPDRLESFWIFLGMGLLCILGAIKYTMGKSAYGYRALGDLAVLIFFGGIGVLGTAYLQKPFVPLTGILVAIMYGMWSVAVLNLNNMRDVDNDIVHGKKTMAYLLGFSAAKIYQTILVLIPYGLNFLVFTMYLDGPKGLLAFSLLPFSLIMVGKIQKVNDRPEFDKFLKIQAILTLLNSIVLFTCIYLLHA